MSKETEFTYNIASDYHFITGREMYGCDVDMLEYKIIGNSANKTVIPVAAIDWKYPSDRITDEKISVNVYNTVADKFNIPFFYVITYLKDEFPVKMYYVIPMNYLAKCKFASANFDLAGEWFTLQRFSKFQHWLRGTTWNENEPIKEKDCTKVGMKHYKTLGDLPNEPHIYRLPAIELSFFPHNSKQVRTLHAI